MASAVLNTQNEPHWRHPNDYMSKYTSISPATTPNKTRNNLGHSHGDFRTGYDLEPCSLPLPVYANSSSKICHSRLGRTKPSSMQQPDLSSPPTSGNSEVKEFRHGRRVTFHLGAHSARELEELKGRLVSELEQVRFLKTRLERINSEARPAYLSYQFSHGCSQQPPALPPPRFPNMIGSESENTKQKVASRRAQSKKKFPVPVPGQGSKRRSQYADDLDPNPKRQAKGFTVQEKILESIMKRCGQILGKVMKDRGAAWFNHPVDVEGLQLFDYYQVVKKPMDLGTVKSNLQAGFYEYPSDFASDVRLTFSNAMMYNPIGHIVHETAKKLLKLFDAMFEPANEKFEAEQRRVSREMEDVARSQPAFVDRVPSQQLYQEAAAEQQLQAVGRTPAVEQQQLRTGKLPKPKARQPNKRGMSTAERSSLMKELEELPNEKLEQVVQIVRKRNQKLDRENGELVLELDEMDVETLWELDRFVNNYRKALKKMKRQEQLQNEDVESKSITEAPETNVEAETNVEVARSKVAEEEVDIGEEIPAGNYPSVQIEKDINGCGSDKSSSTSGGSSGSGDSSSSSDSESGSSSSGSESEEDSVQLQ